MAEQTIHDACRRGDVEAVREMLASDPALVDADDQYKWRPIFHAGLGRHEAVVRLLLDAGADVSAHDGYVMHFAAEMPDNKPVVSLLVQYGAMDAHVRPTSELSRQLLAAVFVGNVSRTKALLEKHPETAVAVDGRGDQPIHHAARNGDTEIVRLLLDAGADANARTASGQTVLYCAGGHAHLETVRLLLDRGAEAAARFSDTSITLLEWFAQYPQDKRYGPIVELLKHHAGRG